MRILIAASTFPRSAADDMPRFVLDLSLALQRRGHRVVALVSTVHANNDAATAAARLWPAWWQLTLQKCSDISKNTT